MEKGYDHGDLQERVIRQNQKVPTNLFLPSVIYNRLHAKLDSYRCPGHAGFRKKPDDGSSHDVQTFCPMKQRMVNLHVGGGDRIPEGVRFIQRDVIWRSLRNILSVSNASVFCLVVC